MGEVIRLSQIRYNVDREDSHEFILSLLKEAAEIERTVRDAIMAHAPGSKVIVAKELLETFAEREFVKQRDILTYVAKLMKQIHNKPIAEVDSFLNLGVHQYTASQRRLLRMINYVTFLPALEPGDAT